MPRPPKLLIALLLLVSAGLAVGCATASIPSPEYTPAQRRVDRLLVGMHLPEYARRLESVALQVAEYPVDGHRVEDRRLRRRIQTQLAPNAVVSDVVKGVAESFDEPAVAQIERFGETDLGRRVHEASGAPYSRLSRLGYRTFGAPEGEPPERASLARKLDELTLASQTSIDLYLRVYEAILRWYAPRAPMDPAASPAVDPIDGLLARERTRLEAITVQHGVPFTLYAFSDLSTADLEEYVALIESPAGQWYSKTAREALIETIDRRCEAIRQR